MPPCKISLFFVFLMSPVFATTTNDHHSLRRIAHHNRRRAQCQPRSSSPQGQTSADVIHAFPFPSETQSTNNIYIPTSPINSLSTPRAVITPTPDVGLPSSSPFSDIAFVAPSSPNGIKAGVAGGDAYRLLQNHIGWWYDWSANPHKPGKPIAVPMLWGSGKVDAQDAERLAQFQRLTSSSSHPKYVLGFEEPDCRSGRGSSGMTVDQAVKEWEALIAPLKRRGTKVGSPSMCKQADETWLREFAKKISTPWDFTAIHVNKNSLAGVKKDVDHYWTTYGKPIWVTEFACVNDHHTFQPCTNQHEINAFIEQAVDHFEKDSRVHAYAFSNGEGLGDVWPMMHNGVFSESGKVYLAAIAKYH